MSKELKKTAYWTPVSLHEALSHKIITRVVSDGIPLKEAVREAIKVAELNKQDIFLLLANLQDSGMVHNGDFKNYWANGWEDSIGSEGIDAHKGTNYYASNNQKVVTAEERNMFSLFDYVDTLRAFATDEEIIEANPELADVVATMNNTQKIVTALNPEEAAELAEKQKDQPAKPEQPTESHFQKAFRKSIELYKQREQAGQVKPFEEIFFSVSGSEHPNIDWQRMAPMIKKFIPDYEPLKHVNPRGINASDSSNVTVAELTVTEAMPQSFNNPVEDDRGDKLGNTENFKEDLADLEEAFNLDETQVEKDLPSIVKHQSLNSHGDKVIIAQAVPEEAPEAEDAGGLEGLGELPEEGAEPGTEELTVEEEAPAEEAPLEEAAGTPINVEITPNPDELIEMAQAGPAWEIQNMLSIQKAEEYYNQLKKQLEDVVFNPNLKIDLNGVAQYDKVRNMIDTELTKINEATKGKEKLEKKEEELEEEIKEPEITVEEEAPLEAPAEAVPEIPEAEPTAQV